MAPSPLDNPPPEELLNEVDAETDADQRSRYLHQRLLAAQGLYDAEKGATGGRPGWEGAVGHGYNARMEHVEIRACGATYKANFSSFEVAPVVLDQNAGWSDTGTASPIVNFRGLMQRGAISHQSRVMMSMIAAAMMLTGRANNRPPANVETWRWLKSLRLRYYRRVARKLRAHRH